MAFARYGGAILRPLLRPIVAGADAALTVQGVELQNADFLLDTGRAERELGFKPQYSLSAGLGETLRGYAKKTP